MDALRGNGAVCVYFADTRTPSLPRAAQRALFAADALPYLDGSSDEAEDNLSPAFWQDALAVRNQAATPATNIADGYENMHDVLMNHVARVNEENPPDGSWKHPVDGEYAVDWQPLASRYLLRDNREFLRHYGKKQPQWLREHGFNEQTMRQLEALLDKKQSNNTLGGDPYFIEQEDPRRADGDDVLLFQLDSFGHANTAGVMWGNDGIGMFFIRPADLHARRFECAWFYWDGC